jgi:hypothetical protein
MSTELKSLKKAGNRLKDIQVTRYWGGSKKCTCYQLTQEMEGGLVGYVQMNEEDLSKLLLIILKGKQ